MEYTIKDAAARLGVSRSTVYRRIRKGVYPSRKVGRRRYVWLETKREGPMQWHPQVHRRTAEQDGKTPADFTWLNYPVSDVVLRLPVEGESSRWNLRYVAHVPPNTPQLNFYVEEKDRQEGVEYEDAGHGWLKIPDPTGTALQSVTFSLIDLADGEVLHDFGSPNHNAGLVDGGMTEAKRDLIWKRLTPGTSLRVRLEAQPRFFPWINTEGGANMSYTTNADGHFYGETASSKEHTLALDYDGILSLDGEVRESIE